MFRKHRKIWISVAVLAVSLVGLERVSKLEFSSRAQALDSTIANNNQIAVLLLVDYARSYGYQTMMARIQLDKDRAVFQRDAQNLQRKEELYRRKAIPLIELEIAQLKDVWNRAQLVVSEKGLAFVTAEYQAMAKLAKHFGGGGKTSIESLYDTFHGGWEAGCAKGPDEVAAAKARYELMVKVVDRARELYRQKNETLASLLEKETQLAVAETEYTNRNSSLDVCRKLLFPSLDEVRKIAP